MIVVMLDCKFIRQKKYPGLLVNIAFFFFIFVKTKSFTQDLAELQSVTINTLCRNRQFTIFCYSLPLSDFKCIRNDSAVFQGPGYHVSRVNTLRLIKAPSPPLL